jgi:phosphoribosylformylglycinamidine synthase
VALAESAFAGGLGMTIDLSCVPASGVDRDDMLLFSESQSRFVVTLAPENRGQFEGIMGSCVAAKVGAVLEDRVFIVKGLKGKPIIREDIKELKAAWQRTLSF